jgi:integrase/recombinase XerD
MPPSGMKTIPLLERIRPRACSWWRGLPIFGPLLDDFVQWLANQGYTVGTIGNYLKTVPKVIGWLRRHRITTLDQVTQQQLRSAHEYYRPKQEDASWVASALERFLSERRLVPKGEAPPPCPVEVEVERFATYLRESRGLAETTIAGHSGILCTFLRFLRLDGETAPLEQLESRQIDVFLRKSAQTNNRFSLQHIVATLRAYLKERHAQGILSRPLHLQIDTPRVYRGERLPRALPWPQVQAFLQSIDSSDPFGRRDFTLLYLGAAYGLRSGELVRLTLDDVDWCERTLRIRQTKTRQTLQLPLTDEAANVLIDYLRKARPESPRRELFLRMRAPFVALQPASVHDVLEHRIRCSGLDLPLFGTHMLRHSFATRLLQQGVSLKAIGDTLGHRDIESTSVYLRLQVDDLREVALPVPAAPLEHPAKLVEASSLLPIRPARPSHHLPANFQSRFAASLQRFVDLKRALGRIYTPERTALGHWDAFVHRQYPRARKVHAELFTEWTKTLIHLTSTGSRFFQRIVRNFLLFHARDQVDTFIPDRLTFPKPAPVVTPRLISEVEMGRVLAVARQLPPSADNPLRAELFYVGLLLLFCCGLRRGELMRLKLADIQEEQTVLHIRLSKFHKSRLVPLSPSVTTELKQYLQARRKNKLPMDPESFLMWSRRRSTPVYADTSLGSLWHRLCVSAGVLNAQGHPPRVHDLRHSCAVLVLQRWYAQGVEVQAKLPHLATYLGHASPVSTHHYLKLTPELRQAASQRFHQRFAPLLIVGGVA